MNEPCKILKNKGKLVIGLCPNKPIVRWKYRRSKMHFNAPNLLNIIASVQFSHSVVSSSLRPHELQHARPPCPSPTPGLHSNSGPSSRWCIQPSHPLSSPSPPAPNPSQHQSPFQWVNSWHEVAKVLEFQLQHHSFQRTPRTGHDVAFANSTRAALTLSGNSQEGAKEKKLPWGMWGTTSKVCTSVQINM